jgi:CRP/FNR family transcriptional regulator
MMQSLSLQVCRLHEQLMLLGRKTAPEKVAAFLLSLIERMDCSTCRHGAARRSEPVTILLRRHEIGDMLGLTHETVSRVLSGFKRLKIIAYRGPDDFTILDTCRLCQLSGSR